MTKVGIIKKKKSEEAGKDKEKEHKDMKGK